MSIVNAASVRASTDVQTASLKDASGLNPSTPAQIQQGRTKCWLNMNGQGTIALRDSFNVSSITDVNVGTYTVAFAVNQPSVDYVVTAAAGSSGINIPARVPNAAPAVSGFGALFAEGSTLSGNDPLYVNLAVDGD